MRWLSLVPLAGVFAIAGALVASTYGLKPHAIVVDLPAPYPQGYADNLTPNVDRLTVSRTGAIAWNGQPVSERELSAILASPRRIESGASLLFTPDAEARYGRALEVLAIVRRHGAIDRCFRLSGIQQYRRFESPETFDDLAPAMWEECLPPTYPRSIPED